jgi:8-oxo-dGTP diphosphatase
MAADEKRQATQVTEVAAAVIERLDGTFLLAQRPEGKPYPDFWEFPGGKIEAGEDAATALARELKEELDIVVTESSPWITRVYAYTHATVRLHFLRVTAWEGEPRPLEGQAIRWQRVGATDVSPMLPANAPVLAALALPAVMIVSHAHEMGVDRWIARLAGRAVDEKLLVQIREKDANAQQVQHILSRALAHVVPLGSRVVVNSASGHFPQCDGVHLTAKDLMQSPVRPAGVLVGASCHDERELDHAEKIGVDYAVVGPVKHTASHPAASPMGWGRFAALIRGRAMPVYAIGGLARGDLAEARRQGAHGVALLSAAFD